MREKRKKSFHLHSLIPQSPLLALISLVLAIFVWWWVQSHDLPPKNSLLTNCNCKCQR